MTVFRIVMQGLSVFLLLLSLTGCNGVKTESFYARMPARFRVDQTQTIPPLHAALTGMGEFATITQRVRTYVYTSLKTSTSRNMTAVDEKNNYLGLSGLVVGLPSIPPLGSPVSVVVCYDLACPNCYENDVVAREMKLQTGGKIHCARCGRVYDLNNQGYVSSGSPGRALFRYRTSYANRTLIVNN